MKLFSIVLVWIGLIASVVSHFPQNFVYYDPTALPSHFDPQHIVVIDAFLDLMCPYSKASYPTITQLPSQYPSGTVLLKISLFPLPFHRNAFYAAQAAQVVYNNFVDNVTDEIQAEKNWRKVYDFSSAFFAVQDSFTNVATRNITADEILAKIARIVESSTGMTQENALVGLQYGTDFDHYARAQWHYGVSRAVPGTPSFFVNGILAEEADSSWTVDEWKTLLNPLVPKSKQL
jgi:hypothetical protein